MTNDATPGNLRVLPTKSDSEEVLGRLREWLKAVESAPEQCTGFAVVAIRGTGSSLQAYLCDGQGQTTRMQLTGAVYILLDDLVSGWRQ